MAFIISRSPHIVRSTHLAARLGAAALLLLATGCGPKPNAADAPGAVAYPPPRYPSYLKPPSSIEEVLPHVRPLARNRTGFQGGGLGIAQPGETVTFVLGPNAEDLIVEYKAAGNEGDLQSTLVKLQTDGSVDVLVGAVDLGEGARTVLPSTRRKNCSYKRPFPLSVLLARDRSNYVHPLSRRSIGLIRSWLKSWRTLPGF